MPEEIVKSPAEWRSIAAEIETAKRAKQPVDTVFKKHAVSKSSYYGHLRKLGINARAKKKLPHPNQNGSGAFHEFVSSESLPIRIEFRGAIVSVARGDSESLRTVLNVIKEATAA